MSGDTFDRFQERERGLFGDNEQREQRGHAPRVTGSSDLVDLKLLMREDRPASIAVNLPAKPKGPWIWLPKSQIEYARAAGDEVEVTLPQWLAEEKGLA